VVSFSWGALAATTLAFILEMIVAVVLIVIAALIVTRLPNSRALLDQLQAQLRLAQRTQDFSAISEWLSNPAVLAALLLYFAVIIPPLEEAVKALVVAFIDPRRTRKADAVLWGMGAGAGFAVVETVFNASVSLAAWAPLILLRVGAAVVHVANGANMGRAWYTARVERRWLQTLLAYVVSVAYHATWNAVAISTSNTALDPARGSVDLTGSALPAVLGLLILVVLSVLGLVWIVRMVGQARRQMVA
jgi:RsiW-degrading membrane proteinase PrsW (M82 family)